MKYPKPDSEDNMIEIFANVFHSFRDLHNVTPLTFVAKLKKRGITLAPCIPQETGQ